MNTHTILYEQMNNKTKDIYLCLFKEKENNIPGTIVQTKVKQDGVIQDSNNSYMFQLEEGEKAGQLLQRLFDLDSKQCEVKIKEACSGSGNEERRILTLISSSLCAFLFFYNVTEKNPLYLKLNGEDCIFTDVIFEYQNKVIEGRNPSNIDIVLLGKKSKDDSKVILFLESKLAEYYRDVTKTLRIANAYKELDDYPIYKNENLNKLDLEIEDLLGENEFKLKSKNGVHYLGGIKQFISHFIGIENFIKDKTSNDIVNKYKNRAEIYLGEIVFTSSGIGELQLSSNEKCFSDYNSMYRKLIKILPNTNIHFLNDLLEYKDIIENHYVEPNVIKFYSL